MPFKEFKSVLYIMPKKYLFFSILYQVNEKVKSIGLQKDGIQDSVVGIAACSELDGPGFDFHQRQVILENHPGQFWGPASLQFSGYRSFYLRLKWPICEIEHSLPI